MPPAAQVRRLRACTRVNRPAPARHTVAGGAGGDVVGVVDEGEGRVNSQWSTVNGELLMEDAGSIGIAAVDWDQWIGISG